MNKIKCPYCGAEYLPQELYIPSDFLPKFDDIVKDNSGKIIAVYEKPIHGHEEYTCDYCSHRFSIDANVEFNTSEVKEHDFNFDHETLLYKEDRVELSEN